MLVEDNPAMQTTLQRSFERRGVQVVVREREEKRARSESGRSRTLRREKLGKREWERREMWTKRQGR